MKKIFLSIIVFITIIGLTTNSFAYTLTVKDKILIDNITKKAEEVIEKKGEKVREPLIKGIKELVYKYKKKPRLEAILLQVIENLEIILSNNKIISGIYTHCYPAGGPSPCLKVDNQYLDDIKTNGGYILLNEFYFIEPGSKISIKVLEQEKFNPYGEEEYSGIWKTKYEFISDNNIEFGDIVFDDCGKPEKYKNQSWFIENNKKSNGEIGHAIEICVANKIGLAIYGINNDSDHIYYPTVKRLWINTDTDSENAYTNIEPDKSIFTMSELYNSLSFKEFGKRKGNLVPVIYKSKNNDKEYILEYDFVKNTLLPIE